MLIHQFVTARPAYGPKRATYGIFEQILYPMAGSIMVKFPKQGRLIAQTSYLRRLKPVKMFGKSFKKSVKVYRRILDLAHCALMGLGALTGLVALMGGPGGPHQPCFIDTKYIAALHSSRCNLSVYRADYSKMRVSSDVRVEENNL